MTALMRLLVSIVVLAGGLVGVNFVQPAWMTAVGVQWPSGRAPATPDQPSHKFIVISQRIKAKTLIARRLQAGEMGLLEAAAWFGYLNETPVEYPEMSWRDQPGKCDGEKLCRQVILWMRGSLQSTGRHCSRTEAWLQELEEELELHLACSGKVQLPQL